MAQVSRSYHILSSNRDGNRPDSKSKNLKDERSIRSWESGKVFTNSPQPSRRRDSSKPWWMQSEEESNPKMLPKYRPWWAVSNFLVDESWKMEQLQQEAIRRGIDVHGMMKEGLIESINKMARLYDLSNDKFTEPVYHDTDRSSLPKCYPQVYARSNLENQQME